jgi:hypothetical protein
MFLYSHIHFHSNINAHIHPNTTNNPQTVQ